MMNAINCWRLLFLSAAIWNFAGAAIAFANLEANATKFFLASSAEFQSVLKMMLILFWWTVFTFGIGYLNCAASPRMNRGILFIAIPDKTACGVLWVHSFTIGHVNSAALAAGVGDLIFAAIFACNLCFAWGVNRVG